ncbi:MAG: universal stress protein [Bacteroidales bacterium]|nr:MAG: universal stress protein [Bacteroidales bacterium]
MTEIKRTILLPYDFTELSDHALQHAVQFAKMLDCDITLLNIIENLDYEIEATEKLTKLAKETQKDYKILPKIMVRPGKVSKAITRVATNLNALLVIMKTSGPKGIKKFTGSRAIKVMSGSQIPFIVIQAPPKRNNIKHVIVPIDFRFENKEKLKWINFLVKVYRPSVSLFRPAKTDYRIRNNLKFAMRFLEGRNINFELVHARGKKSFVEETLEFSDFIGADLIVVMLSRQITMAKIIFGLKDQKFISNNFNIPIMCLNPRTDLRKYAGFN